MFREYRIIRADIFWHETCIILKKSFIGNFDAGSSFGFKEFMLNKKNIDKILDVKGLLCPAPTVMTSKALKEMKKGKILQVITNDMSTTDSISSLCTREGYNLLETKEIDGLLYFTIRK